MISYGSVREYDLPFNVLTRALQLQLHKKGFEILSEIALDEEVRNKLGIEFRNYLVFSVCNLPLAYKALIRDENFGMLLTCNVILYEKSDGTCVAGMIRPTIFMPLVGNASLEEGAAIIERKLTEVLDRIGRTKLRPCRRTAKTAAYMQAAA